MNVVGTDPIPLFNHLAIETASICNRSCVFCPNHHNARPDELMPMETIVSIVQQLKAIKWKGRLALYIYNEPTRDPRLKDIARYISQELPNASLMIATNCDYLKRKEDLAALYDAGIRQVILNVYSAQDGCGNPAKESRGLIAAAKRADQLEKWVEELGLETGKDMYGHAPRSARRARVERKYGIKGDTAMIGAFELQNRSGNIPWFQAEVEPIAKMCVRPWRSLNINWLGEAILCCNDYHGTTMLGNVNDLPLLDIWNGAPFNRYRVALQNKDRNVNLCDKCDYGGGHYKHLVKPVTFGSDKRDRAEVAKIRPSIPINLSQEQ